MHATCHSTNPFHLLPSPLSWRQSSGCFHFCGLDYEEKGILDQFSRSISFFAQTQRFFLPLLVGLHGSTDTTSTKSAIKEKIFWKVTISSALISFLQKIIARLIHSFFHLYLLLKPREKCFCFRRRVTWSWHNILYFVSSWWSFRHVKLKAGGEMRARILAIEFVCFFSFFLFFFFFRSYF